jgi:sRNA-binding protein
VKARRGGLRVDRLVVEARDAAHARRLAAEARARLARALAQAPRDAEGARAALGEAFRRERP